MACRSSRTGFAETLRGGRRPPDNRIIQDLRGNSRHIHRDLLRADCLALASYPATGGKRNFRRQFGHKFKIATEQSSIVHGQIEKYSSVAHVPGVGRDLAACNHHSEGHTQLVALAFPPLVRHCQVFCHGPRSTNAIAHCGMWSAAASKTCEPRTPFGAVARKCRRVSPQLYIYIIIYPLRISTIPQFQCRIITCNNGPPRGKSRAHARCGG